MGSERASTARKRLAGEICCACRRWIDDPPEKSGERYCADCLSIIAEARQKLAPHAIPVEWEQKIDYERLGPAMILAAAQIFAIRTARQPTGGMTEANRMFDIHREMDHAIATAHTLVEKACYAKPAMFPKKRVPVRWQSLEDGPP
jgi:hypothetical protein